MVPLQKSNNSTWTMSLNKLLPHIVLIPKEDSAASQCSPPISPLKELTDFVVLRSDNGSDCHPAIVLLSGNIHWLPHDFRTIDFGVWRRWVVATYRNIVSQDFASLICQWAKHLGKEATADQDERQTEGSGCLVCGQ